MTDTVEVGSRGNGVTIRHGSEEVDLCWHLAIAMARKVLDEARERGHLVEYGIFPTGMLS